MFWRKRFDFLKHVHCLESGAIELLASSLLYFIFVIFLISKTIDLILLLLHPILFFKFLSCSFKVLHSSIGFRLSNLFKFIYFLSLFHSEISDYNSITLIWSKTFDFLFSYFKFLYCSYAIKLKFFGYIWTLKSLRVFINCF